MAAQIDKGAVARQAAVVLEALQHAGENVELGQRVGQAAGELLLRLQAAAERGDGEIGNEGEAARAARQLTVPVSRVEGFLRQPARTEPPVTLWKKPPQAFATEKAT